MFNYFLKIINEIKLMKLMKWNEIKYSINYIKYVSNKNNEKTKLRTIECYFLIFMDNWMNNFYMI